MPNTYPGRPAVISLCVAAAFGAFTAESTAAEPAGSKRALLERVDTLEKRLDDLQRRWRKPGRSLPPNAPSPRYLRRLRQRRPKRWLAIR